jgi:hypothetical protein
MSQRIGDFFCYLCKKVPRWLFPYTRLLVGSTCSL